MMRSIVIESAIPRKDVQIFVIDGLKSNTKIFRINRYSNFTYRIFRENNNSKRDEEKCCYGNGRIYRMCVLVPKRSNGSLGVLNFAAFGLEITA